MWTFGINYHITKVVFYIINTTIVEKTREPKDEQLYIAVQNNIIYALLIPRLNLKVNL